MLKLFKKKTEIERLQEKYKKLMQESHKLSTINRSKSDDKFAEADVISKQIDALQTK
ncbi:GTP cyclohydrolase I [Tamlana sedimentorum]|uniref:GTP cyclohydrolase I n=1 Tax=Neotamlana sedimentorum TaxID=1435349 RepID=A0A0D7WAG8_9FLAO|nr:Lacal_2735 family protein [Tamlana sedimentorum]KJD36136.1 GTP cyclohydrolase I [Tamlana sedimentorum]